jgi:hypothetical protein
VEALRPGAIHDEFEQPGGLAAGNPECHRHLPRIQPKQRSRSRGGAKGASAPARQPEDGKESYSRLAQKLPNA